MSNVPGNEESEAGSLLQSLMLAMRQQQLMELQEALAESHRDQQPAQPQPQQQQQRAAAADSASEAGDEVYATKPNCKPGGYAEESFIHLSEADKEEFGCRICFNIIRDCYECRNAHRFCYACIYEWSEQSGQGSNLCPVCRCPGEYAHNASLNERLGKRRVRCTEAPPGKCNWRGCLSDLDGHKHRQYELHEIYTSSELPSLRPERTGETVSGQRLTTTELVKQHSEAKTAAAAATTPVETTAASITAAGADSSGGARLLGRRQQDSARRLPSAQQRQQLQQQDSQPQQSQPLQYKRLVRPRPPPPSAAQRLRESREQLSLLMTLLTIQMQERQQAMQQAQLEARRREIERRRQLAEIDNLNRRLAQVAADVNQPTPQQQLGQQQQPLQQPQQQRQLAQQQQPQQQAAPRLPAIGASVRSNSTTTQRGGTSRTGGGGGGSNGHA
ncbi:hypothetical protein BOX15_Mlig026247g1 [Macrostomum lignano]|uniref:RING-type domain-containing protein n=1 Tax=Macrostomum lignano TaxID=282301 RepID=A0A267DCY9_9PLAT|nr:hypothetical protein BOX15_Mlig026247g1 [Macrostomum lignano]